MWWTQRCALCDGTMDTDVNGPQIEPLCRRKVSNWNKAITNKKTHSYVSSSCTWFYVHTLYTVSVLGPWCRYPLHSLRLKWMRFNFGLWSKLSYLRIDNQTLSLVSCQTRMHLTCTSYWRWWCSWCRMVKNVNRLSGLVCDLEISGVTPRDQKGIIPRSGSINNHYHAHYVQSL